MRVILVLDVAPDYRELFLRNLSKQCDLIVLAHSCEKDNLSPPVERIGYTYHELKDFGYRLRWNNELKRYVSFYDPDMVCVNLNLRYPKRVLDFFSLKMKGKRWIWWGPVFGRHDILNPIKRNLIKFSDGALVYTDDIVKMLENVNNNIVSFNNSQHSIKDFINNKNKITNNKVNCLFVGRPQPRKRLELLIELAIRREDINIRMVGPGMETYFKNIFIPDNVRLYPEAHNNVLAEHFNWSNIVINPGHVGLLVMNAAAHCRPIVIDSKVNHAPEVILAKAADQYFIDFLNDNEVELFFDKILDKPESISHKGIILFNLAKRKFTIEHMVKMHINIFKKVIH